MRAKRAAKIVILPPRASRPDAPILNIWRQYYSCRRFFLYYLRAPPGGPPNTTHIAGPRDHGTTGPRDHEPRNPRLGNKCPFLSVIEDPTDKLFREKVSSAAVYGGPFLIIWRCASCSLTRKPTLQKPYKFIGILIIMPENHIKSYGC